MDAAGGHLDLWPTTEDRQDFSSLNLTESNRALESSRVLSPLTISIPEDTYSDSPSLQSHPSSLHQWPPVEWTSSLQANPQTMDPFQEQGNPPPETHVAPDVTQFALVPPQHPGQLPELAVHEHFFLGQPNRLAVGDHYQSTSGALNVNNLPNPHHPPPFMPQNQTLPHLNPPGVAVQPAPPHHHQVGPMHIHRPEASLQNYPAMAFPFPQPQPPQGPVIVPPPLPPPVNVGTFPTQAPPLLNPMVYCQELPRMVPFPMNAGYCPTLPVMVPPSANAESWQAQPMVPAPTMNIGTGEIPPPAAPANLSRSTQQPPRPSREAFDVHRFQSPFPPKRHYEEPNQVATVTSTNHRQPKNPHGREDKIPRTMGPGTENRGPHYKSRKCGESQSCPSCFQDKKPEAMSGTQQDWLLGQTVLTETNKSFFHGKP